MKKNAFTMVELIIIMVIIGVILVFSLPKITSTLEKNKKDAMIVDAKNFVEMVKTHLSITQDYPTQGSNKVFTLDGIDTKKEIDKSPYGNSYNRSDSIVTVVLDRIGSLKSYRFVVVLTDDKYTLNTRNSDYSELNGTEKYEYILRK